jgi:hypothetical protein
MRTRPSPDPFEPFVGYVSVRLAEDSHLWAWTLFDGLERSLGGGVPATPLWCCTFRRNSNIASCYRSMKLSPAAP